jgi:hypothetical protein
MATAPENHQLHGRDTGALASLAAVVQSGSVGVPGIGALVRGIDAAGTLDLDLGHIQRDDAERYACGDLRSLQERRISVANRQPAASYQ